jgi:trk system potassium uptake protein TrkH
VLSSAAADGRRVPLLARLALILAASMQVPATHAALTDAHETARAFFYSGLVLGFVSGGIALAMRGRASRSIIRSHLLALLGAMVLLPAAAAVPFHEALGTTRWINAYVEMVAAVTTTGGTLFDPDRLDASLHLWRALLAWQGGFLILVAAVAILAPIGLGGFELGRAAARPGSDAFSGSAEGRVTRHARQLAPIYAGLTAALWMALFYLGEAPTDAAILAMSIISTSGIHSGGGLAASPANPGAEIVAAAFLLLAVSRNTFASDLHRGGQGLLHDRELRLAGILVAAVTTLLMLRQFAVQTPGDPASGLGEAARAAWGAAFTTLSFLTTTGFESAQWSATRAWAGLDAMLVLLIGLAVFGGGVATTAGGVKLLRLMVLYEHGRREMHLLVHPHGIVGGSAARGLAPLRAVQGAWIFFMLFAVSIAGFTVALALTGLGFTEAMILALSGLTTTGPIAEMALGTGPARGLGALGDATKLVWAGAMVIGRLETVALVALLNPEFWRR